MSVIEPNRFPDSVFDRIGSYLPADQRASYFRYVAHLRTLNPKDELLVLAEGMAIFACLSRQVPEAIGDQREKLLAEFARLCSEHESATTRATADVRALFAAQQKNVRAKHSRLAMPRAQSVARARWDRETI